MSRQRRPLRTIIALAMVLTLQAGVFGSPASVVAANPSANLDQCANGSFGNQSDCTGRASSWVNGNLGASKAHYLEGEAIPYRMLFGNLTNGETYHVTIEWDTTKGGKHAIDYLTTYDRDVAANPRLGVHPIVSGTASTYPIPPDAYVTGAGVSQSSGDFTLFGGTITSVSAYAYSGSTSADSSNRITVTFTAGARNPVLAWGGHISSRRDWGRRNSAVAISGSPYHMRLIDLNGQGGNQDRSLSADAVLFPGSLEVVKEIADEESDGNGTFAFTAGPAPLANFSLTTVEGSAQTSFAITSFTRYAISETVPTGWDLSSAICDLDPETDNGGLSSAGGTGVSINFREGEEWTCTFTNERLYGDLTLTKSIVWDPEPVEYAATFLVDYDCTAGTSGHDAWAGTTGTEELGDGSTATIAHLPVGARCVVTERTPLPAEPAHFTWTDGSPTYDPGSVVTIVAPERAVTVTNSLARNYGGLRIDKALVGGPADFTGPFTIGYDCTEGTSGLEGWTAGGTVEVSAGSHETITGLPSGAVCTVTELSTGSVTGYDFRDPVYSPVDGVVTIPDDGSVPVQVTVTNTLVPNSQITGTNETCQTFTAGTALDLAEIQYSSKSGTITQINPGVLYYWAIVHESSFDVTQGTTPGVGRDFTVAAGSGAYDTSCSRTSAQLVYDAGTVHVSGLGAGTHIIGIKFSVNALVGGSAGPGGFIASFAASEATYREVQANRKQNLTSPLVGVATLSAAPTHGKALAKGKAIRL